jgi:tetratricopeptide (TPR) repeat protein
VSRTRDEDSQFAKADNATAAVPSENSVNLVRKSVTAEGEQSVAIGEASNSVVNTGVVHGDINVTVIESPTKSTFTRDNIGPALNLIKLTQSLSSDLSKRIARELEEAREAFREGDRSQSFEDVKAISRLDNWDALDPPVRAMVMRALANMVLSLKGKEGIHEAEAYIKEASQFDSNCDVHTVHVRIKALRHGLSAALADLANPTSLDAFNLRVGMLIEAGELDQALALLESPSSQISLDAESYRLKALASLLSHNLVDARAAKDDALKLKPNRQDIRIAAALVDYYLSLSPLALHTDALLHPHPLNPALVKRDDESQERLRLSATTFAKIAQEFAPKSNAQKEIETWQVACVANISDATAEALELCRSILARDPTHFRVLAWVLQRRYEIELGPSEEALNALLTENAVDDVDRLHYVLALLGIYINKPATPTVLELLERERKMFDRMGRLDQWRYWRGQALIDNDDPETALELSTEIEDLRLGDTLKVLALCEIGNRDRNWSQLIEFLEAEWEQTKNPQFLIHLCEIKAQMGDWPYVANHAEEYCDTVGTAPSAYLAINASRNAHRNQLCLHLLQKCKDLFPGSKLPEDLRRLQAYCKLETQDVRGAVTDIEKLAAENDSVENILSLIDVLRATGDVSGVERAARRLRTRELTPFQCLQLSEIVRLEDIELAKEFWRRAKDDAQKDKLLAPVALMLAFKLGLDREVGSLWGPVDEIARSDDQTVQMIDVDQVVTQMREYQSSRENINKLYTSGEAPLATVAERVNRPMIDIFNGLADENSSISPAKWERRPRLFVRHGARLIPPPESFERSNEWHLHVDLTSLMLADHLGLLDKIEQTFRPLAISSKIPSALLAQRSELLDIQQSRLENYRTIVRLADDGKLRTFHSESSEIDINTIQKFLNESVSFDGPEDKSETANMKNGTSQPMFTQVGISQTAAVAGAVRHDGFAVGLLPLRDYQNSKLIVLTLPEALGNRIVNCRAVVESLRHSDRISDQVFDRAVSALGTEADPNLSPAAPLIYSELYLMQGVADVLAGADVLEQTCDSFIVSISDKCLIEALQAIQEYSRRGTVAAQAEGLVQRINAGLENGTYQFISISDERLNETADVQEVENLDLAATADLLRCRPNDGDVFWIDDRALNKYPVIEGAPIIGINEILLALRQRELIDKHEYYQTILKLRRQNFRYIPIDEDEIAYHLRRSRIINGSISETEGLSTLRRYAASSLLDTESLQPNVLPGGTRNRFGEIDFVTACQIAFNAAIAMCWEDETISVEMARTRADWILDNLYIGLFGGLHVQARNVTGILPYRLLGRDLAGLLMNAVKISDPLHPERASEKRAAYFQWLEVRVTGPRFRSEPKIRLATAREVERMFTLFTKRGKATTDGAVFERILLQRLFLDLPDELRDEIELDNETREWLGVMTFSAAQVSGHTFDGQEFVLAVESALHGEDAAIKTQDEKQEFRFRIVDSDLNGDVSDAGPVIGVFDNKNHQHSVLNDHMLKVLSPNMNVREQTLQMFREWFDGTDQEFASEVHRIAETDNPHERLELAKQLQVESSEAFYQHIEYRLRHRKLFSPELIPRSVGILLKRFKLPATFEGDFLDVWDGSANDLLNAVGLQRAIERCSCLPVRMPVSIIEAFTQLPNEKRRSLIEALQSRLTSPIAKLHLVNLLLRGQREDEIAEAQTILTALYHDTAAEEFRAFHAVLVFVHGELENSRDISEVSAQIRLALTWGHASELHHIFHSLGFSSTEIVDMFRRHTRQRAAEAILRASASWDDSLHPNRFNRTTFLTHGVGKMLSRISDEVVKRIGIIPLIEEKIVRDVNGLKIPDIPLLQDSTLLNDGLSSIFGGDHAEALAILEDDAVELVSSRKLREMVEQSLNQIIEDRNGSGWFTVMLVLGDLPIYADLQAQMRAAMTNIEIDDSFMGNQKLGHPAFITAANQVRHWGDEALRLAIEEKVLAAIKYESERNISTDAETDARDKRVIDLVDAGLKCSLVRGNLDETGRRLARMLEGISVIWPRFSKRFGATICEFIWELPVEVIISWWPLLLKLRATMDSSI